MSYTLSIYAGVSDPSSLQPAIEQPVVRYGSASSVPHLLVSLATPGTSTWTSIPQGGFAVRFRQRVTVLRSSASAQAEYIDKR